MKERGIVEGGIGRERDREGGNERERDRSRGGWKWEREG